MVSMTTGKNFMLKHVGHSNAAGIIFLIVENLLLLFRKLLILYFILYDNFSYLALYYVKKNSRIYFNFFIQSVNEVCNYIILASIYLLVIVHLFISDRPHMVFSISSNVVSLYHIRQQRKPA